MNNIDKNIQSMIKEYGDHNVWIENFNEGYKWAPKNKTQSIINFIQKYIRLPTENILEIAVGYGRLTRLLNNYCDNLCGIDLNKCCIDFCRELIPGAHFIQNDGLSIPFDIKFDLVVSYASMVHFDKEVVWLYMIEIKRALKKNGIAILHHSANGINRIGNRSNMTSDLMKSYCNSLNLHVIDQVFWYQLTDNSYNDCVSIITIK